MYRYYNRSPRRYNRYPRYGYGYRSPYSSYYSPWDTSDYYYGGYGYRSRPYYWDWDYDRFYDRYRRSWSPDDTGGRDDNRGDTDPSPRPRPRPEPEPRPEPPEEEIVKILKVKDIDLNISDNTKAHHTDEYECTSSQLVVRRGQSFKVTINFYRPYVKAKNDIKIIFQKGKNPMAHKGTKVVMEVDESDNKKTFDDDEWGAWLASMEGNSITVDISIPANCIIGPWNMLIQSISEGKDKDGNEKRLSFKFEYPEDIYILFNPWCKADTVYMATEDELNEYILNEMGCYYWGNAWSPAATAWTFGQFQEGILEAALYLVRAGVGGRETDKMSDPVFVSRIISKMVNSQDDNGVLVGNWSGEYRGGTSPTKWKSSVSILQEYMEKNAPVKFGQCWVFSCVVTTVCRALGIPCRCITNFNSAHDTDKSNTLEKVFRWEDDELKPVEGAHGDSVWNFHCWNEAWFARPDLEDSSFGGWQVIDATPQETSEGVFQCGPCPVAAIKKGLCKTDYDASFIFSEVNADEVHYVITNNYDTKVLSLDKTNIGKKISTKKPNGLPFKIGYDRAYRLDVTSGYKFPEGSVEERNAVAMAQKTADKPSSAYKELEETKDVVFDIVHSNDIMVGSPLEISVTAKNEGPVERKVPKLGLEIFTKKYTGERSVKPILKKRFSFKLKPSEDKLFTVTMDEQEYFPHLKEQMNLYIELTWTVDKAGDRNVQANTKSHEFRFRRPDLDVYVPINTIVGKPIEIEVSFKNPLSVPLTKCDLSYEGTGFKNERDIPQRDVPPKAEFKTVIKTVPKKKGNRSLVFTFDCRELPDISGVAIMTVEPN